MVRQGNVRMDVSISAELDRRLRAALHLKGLDKKGGLSDAVTTALEKWLEEASAPDA